MIDDLISDLPFPLCSSLPLCFKTPHFSVHKPIWSTQRHRGNRVEMWSSVLACRQAFAEDPARTYQILRFCITESSKDRAPPQFLWYHTTKEPMPMTLDIHLQLPPEYIDALRQHAAANGEDIDAYVSHLITDHLQSDATCTRRPNSWAARHPQLQHVIDDSRESIYAGCGE